MSENKNRNFKPKHQRKTINVLADDAYIGADNDVVLNDRTERRYVPIIIYEATRWAWLERFGLKRAHE